MLVPLLLRNNFSTRSRFESLALLGVAAGILVSVVLGRRAIQRPH